MADLLHVPQPVRRPSHVAALRATRDRDHARDLRRWRAFQDALKGIGYGLILFWLGWQGHAIYMWDKIDQFCGAL